MNYLYIYNYFAPYEESLVKCEFEVFFNTSMTSRYHFSNKDININRSVFMKERIDILYTGHSIEELKDILKDAKLSYIDFKLVYYKNKISHVDYQESLSWLKELSEYIDGSVSINHPKVELALTYMNETYYFGILHKNRNWNKYERKPYSYSYSLPVRIARTLINIGTGTHDDYSIIDPCCGVGTVVLEGLDMGFDIVGSDRNRFVAYKARHNLEYYHYDPMRIQRKDIQDISTHYDVSIIDIPYGVYTDIDPENIINIINCSRRICDILIIVSHEDISDMVRNAGYSIDKQCYHKKGNFIRYIIKAY